MDFVWCHAAFGDMKILVVLNQSCSTANNEVYFEPSLCPFLNELGGMPNIAIDVFALSVQIDPCGRPKEKLTQTASIKIHHLNIDNLGLISRYYKAACILFKLIGSNECVYIFFPGALSLFAAPLSLFRGKKYYLYVRGTWTRQIIGSRLTNLRMLRWIYERIIIFASGAIVTGINLLNRVKVFKSNAWEVVPMLSIPIQSEITPKRIKYSKPLQMLFIGRGEINKGLYVALETLKIFWNEGRDVRVTVCGPLKQELNASELSVVNEFHSRIDWKGYLASPDDLVSVYQKTDVLLFPSKHEGFPRVVYEAMFFGVPPVAYDTDFFNGFLIHGVNALVAPPCHGDLALVARRLFEEEALLSQLSEGAIRTMQAKKIAWATDTHASQLVRLVRSV